MVRQEQEDGNLSNKRKLNSNIIIAVSAGKGIS